VAPTASSACLGGQAVPAVLEHLEACLKRSKVRFFDSRKNSFESQAKDACHQLLNLGTLLLPENSGCVDELVVEHAYWLISRDPKLKAQLEERERGLEELEDDDEAWWAEYQRRRDEWHEKVLEGHNSRKATR